MQNIQNFLSDLGVLTECKLQVTYDQDRGFWVAQVVHHTGVAWAVADIKDLADAAPGPAHNVANQPAWASAESVAAALTKLDQVLA